MSELDERAQTEERCELSRQDDRAPWTANAPRRRRLERVSIGEGWIEEGSEHCESRTVLVSACGAATASDPAVWIKRPALAVNG